MKDFEKFSGKNEYYAKYRPTYPADCIAYLSSELGMRDALVADIGSGTGIFTRLLSPIAKHVYAVEPNPDMRESLRSQNRDFQNISILEGTAEYSTLPDHSVDFVTAAQAFHWFDEKAFQKECRRTLKTEGKVVLVWNRLDDESPIVSGIKALCEHLGIPYRRISLGQFTYQKDFHSFFKSGVFDKKTFSNEIILEKEAFIGRHLSSSYAPQKGERNFENFVIGLRNLFEQNMHNEQIAHPYQTLVFSGKV